MNQPTQFFFGNWCGSHSGRLVFALIIILTASGCSTLINRTVDGVSTNLVDSIMNQDDPETVRQAMPAYLILVDSFVQGDPPKTSSLRSASSLYAAYGSTFVDDEVRASKLTARAWRYGQQALCQRFDVNLSLIHI